MRVRAALFVVCYASVLLAFATPHDAFRCRHPTGPHCAACASLQAIPIPVEAERREPHLATSLLTLVNAPAMIGVLGAADAVTRAPPASLPD